MAKIIKKLSNSTFELLLHCGHAVPRTENNYIQTGFRVGGEYTVSNKDGTQTLNVVCTQNMPIHLKVI